MSIPRIGDVAVTHYTYPTPGRYDGETWQPLTEAEAAVVPEYDEIADPDAPWMALGTRALVCRSCGAAVVYGPAHNAFHVRIEANR